MLWVRISIRVRCTILCYKVCQWLATGRWFSPGSRVSCTNKTDRHDITEILLKVALNTIKQTNKQNTSQSFFFTVSQFYRDLVPEHLNSSPVFSVVRVARSLVFCEVFCLFVCLMVFNATFNNISVISWRSVLLVQETWEPGENHRPVASHWQTL
jgi:hypothetical protein